MGLSASVKALALYCMQSMVRFSAARVLQRTLAIGSDADDGALADGEYLTIHLILAFTLQDNVQFLVSLVGMQETTVLTRNERLKTQFAPCSTYGLTCEHLTLNDLI